MSSHWTGEELNLLKEMYPQYAREGKPLYTLTDILPDRSANAIEHKLRELRAQSPLMGPYYGYYPPVTQEGEDILPRPKIARLFWDIETSPNVGFFWRPGYKVNISPDNIIQEKAIICICWKWEGSEEVFYLTWDDGDDKAMLEAFLEVASEADEMIAHNGDYFDLKWFNTQCLQHGLDPLPEPKTVDTLVIARRRFYLNSNRLDYLAKLLLGKGKIHVEYQLWKDVVLQKDLKALQEMVEYCMEDVRVVERIFERISVFHAPKTHVGVLNGLPKWTCARCGSKDVRRKKRRVTAKGTIQHSMACKHCRGYYTISDSAYSKIP